MRHGPEFIPAKLTGPLTSILSSNSSTAEAIPAAAAYWKVVFDNKIDALAPGQFAGKYHRGHGHCIAGSSNYFLSAVFYIGKTCLGAGVIAFARNP